MVTTPPDLGPQLESDEVFRMLVEQIRDYAIFMLDRTGHVATWNEGASRLKGYTASEIIGRHMTTFYQPEDRWKCAVELEAARRDGRVEDEGWRVRKDGTLFWASVVITAIYDADRRLVGFAKVTRDLNERRAAEEEVRRSEERLRLMVESVKDYAIFMLDPAGRVVTWNVGAQRLKGYTADEIIGSHFSRFYPAEDVRDGKCERELEIAAREGRFEDEGWRIRKDGTRFFASVAITATRDGRGELVGFAKVTRDITVRREAEAARIRLAEETAARHAEAAGRAAAEKLQASLSTMLRSIGEAVIATDAGGNVALMNRVAEGLTGWSEADARGHALAQVFRIVNERTRETVPSPVDRVLEKGVTVGLANHTLLIARDGREIVIDDSGAPIRGADGAVDGVILVFRDITAKKREAARRELLAHVTAVLAQSLEVEATLSEITRLAIPKLADWCALDLCEPGQRAPKRVAVAHVDPAKVQFAKDIDAKYPPAPDAPTGVPNVLRTGRSELYPNVTDEMLVAGCVDEEHLRIARALSLRSGMVVPLIARGRVLGALTFVMAESGRHYTTEDLQFAEEVAGRCATAMDNARLYASEQSARRGADVANRAKDEFLAVVSHELRNPLSAITGWARMLESGRLDETKHERAFETIGRNARAMAQLIEDLLDMSRVIGGKMRLDVQRVNLGEIVELALESMKPAAAAKDLRISSTVDHALPALIGDPGRLQQVTWNLLSNAVKFSARGGSVDVRVALVDSWAEFTVADTGKGIAHDFLPFVFDPFRQEEGGPSRARGGLGLGLAISRQLVELHGGRIEVSSAGEGLGATFVVRLPISAVREVGTRPGPATAHDVAVPARHEAPSQLRGLHVLVVDDEEDARLLIKAVLEECGCRLTLTASVAEAMQAISVEPPDLLISDIGMPGQDGTELIRLVRALPRDRGGDVPAAALTAYARPEDRRQLLNAGFSTHLAKPVEPAELVAVAASLTRFAHPRADV